MKASNIAIISYAVLLAILLLPQINENSKQYIRRCKIILMLLFPCVVSVITMKCLDISCPNYALLNAYIIMLWSICVCFMYLYKKLI